MTTAPAPAVAAVATVAPVPPATISFPQGMPGFPGASAYRLEPVAGASGRFLRLRSLAGEGPAFLVVADADGAAVAGSGAADGPLLAAADLAAGCADVGLDPGATTALLVVTTRRDAEGALSLTVNRRAPVLLDTRREVAFQVVLPRPDYAVRHPLAT